MKRALAVLFVMCLTMLAAAQSAPAAPAGVSPEDAAAIRATALNYCEGWYAGDADRMASALHPELVKRIMNVDPKSGHPRLDGMGKSVLVESTRAGFGTHTPVAEQQKDIVILDVFHNAASVRATMSGWVDYMHMVKWEGKWLIVNVLWEKKPPPAK